MRMKPLDVMGSLYSSGGLRFGGFQTPDYLDATEPLEEKQPGIREKIIAEAHYIVYWLHRFPEICFFLGIILYRSISLGLLLFAAAYILEVVRFYAFGPSILLSHACRAWNWVKAPAFIVAAGILWPDGILLPITLLVFLVVQGWFSAVSSVGMLPVRFVITRIVYKRYGGHWHNMEGMAISFVINKWRIKLFPADRFNIE